MRAARFETTSTPSPLKGVRPEAWTKFVELLETLPPDSISESGGLGAFDMRPRRLVELGYATGLRYEKGPTGRYLHVCEFILPWTQKRFLGDRVAQYVAVAQSMLLYHGAILDGRLKKPSVSMSGALGVLHRAGRGAFDAWPDLFDSTRALFKKVDGLF